MKIGISTASFFGRTFTEEAPEQLRRLGCDLTEVFFNTYSEYEEDFAEMLAGRMGDIKVHSVHALGTQFEPELYSINPRVRRDAEKLFVKVCRAAQILGARFYTFHGPYRMKKKKYIINYSDFGARTDELCAEAKKYGVRLSYENVHYAYFNEPEFFVNLSAHSKDIMATLDIKQALQGGGDIAQFIDVMGERLSTVHICEINEGKTGLPTGAGFNYGKLFEKLNSVAYRGPVILEVYTKDYENLSQLKASFEYIKNLAQSY